MPINKETISQKISHWANSHLYFTIYALSAEKIDNQAYYK